MNQNTFHQLTAEHRCLLALADRIEQQLVLLREGSSLDFTGLMGQVGFLREHFVNAHGPKDDVVVTKLLASSSSTRALLSPLLNAHRDAFLAHLGKFENGLQAALCEQPVPRAVLAQHGDECVRNLRAQISMEESAMYPWARARLNARGREEVARAIDVISKRWPSDACARSDAALPQSLVREDCP